MATHMKMDQSTDSAFTYRMFTLTNEILTTTHPGCYYSEIGRYSIGQKCCQVCEIYIEWSGFRCPCCHTKLRRTPRPKKYRQRLRLKELD